MTCDRARSLLLDTPEGIQRAALWLHLRLCGACRREAGRIRALLTALEGLPRFGPSADLLPAVLAIPQHVGRPQAAQKERFNVTRLAYVLTLIIAVTLLAGGILTRSTAPDGATLLLNAAQAMEDVQTIHMVGRGSTRGEHPWGRMSDGTYESWYAPVGHCAKYYNPDGTLKGAWVYNIQKGVIWRYMDTSKWFPNGVTVIYRVDPSLLSTEVANSRERYLNGEVWFSADVEAGAPVKTWEALRDKGPVRVVEITRVAPSGDVMGTTEYDLDPRTGRLLGYVGYGPASYGRPMTGYTDVLQYGGEVPTDVFEFTSPPGAAVIEGDFGVGEGGWLDIRHPSFPSPSTAVEPGPDWTISGSVSRSASLAIDGDPETYWSVAGPLLAQQGGLWLQLDFATPVAARKMTVHHGEAEITTPPAGIPQAGWGSSTSGGAGMSSDIEKIPAGGWPRGLRVTYTEDGKTWHRAYTGQAAANRPAYAHFGKLRHLRGVRLELTEATDEEPWVVSEIVLYGDID